MVQNTDRLNSPTMQRESKIESRKKDEDDEGDEEEGEEKEEEEEKEWNGITISQSMKRRRRSE